MYPMGPGTANTFPDASIRIFFRGLGFQMPPVGSCWVYRGLRPVQSALHEDILHWDAPITVFWKNRWPTRNAGGMIDSLNRKATERITTRPTPVGIIASVSARANRRQT